MWVGVGRGGLGPGGNQGSWYSFQEGCVGVGGCGEEGLGPVGNLDILRLLVQLSGRSVVCVYCY